MRAIGAILVVTLSAVALLGLLVAVINDRKRQQRIAEARWKDVEGKHIN
jgi:hypothetical protein